MRRPSAYALLVLLPALLALQSCSWLGSFTGGSTESTESSSSSSEETLSRYTDVSLQGVVWLQPGASDAYELRTPGGSSFALVNGTYDFAEYDGKEVEISGSLEESLDGTIRLLTVRELTEVVGDSSSSESSSEVSSESSSSSVSSASSQAVSSMASAASSKISSAAKSSSSVAVSSISSVASSSAGSDVMSAEWKARMQKMAKARGPETWTQQYCSSHVGVCFPVRSDYWYRSFGASAGSLWHVELNSEDILNLGDGPLVVDLVSGRLEGELTDGLIREADGSVFGYRAWTNNRYFRVSAPKELRASVEIITKGIAPYETPAP